MGISLLNGFPTPFMPEPGQAVEMRELPDSWALELLLHGLDSYVDHESFAAVLEARTGVEIPVNPAKAPPVTRHDWLLIASAQPPRQLAEGEVWGYEEILSMPIKWTLVKPVR